MSLSSAHRSLSSDSKAIPRKMLITDPSQLPNDFSSTPGGTLYSTTPGGTKIVYERAFLLNLRNSPISQTPPKCSIPNGLMRAGTTSPVENNHLSSPTLPINIITTIDEASEQFPMDL